MDNDTPVVTAGKSPPPDTQNRFPCPLSVRFDRDTVAALDKLARARNRSRNAEVRAAVRAYLSAFGEVAT